jgi:hypothetical protein
VSCSLHGGGAVVLAAAPPGTRSGEAGGIADGGEQTRSQLLEWRGTGKV